MDGLAKILGCDAVRIPGAAPRTITSDGLGLALAAPKPSGSCTRSDTLRVTRRDEPLLLAAARKLVFCTGARIAPCAPSECVGVAAWTWPPFATVAARTSKTDESASRTLVIRRQPPSHRRTGSLPAN